MNQHHLLKFSANKPSLMSIRFAVVFMAFLLMLNDLFSQDSLSVVLDTMQVSVNDINQQFKASRKHVIDIQHVKLEIRPSFESRQLFGKAYLNIQPYNKAVDRFELDAKGMEIRQVYLTHPDGSIPVKYTYDNLLLTIELNREYKMDEQFTLFVDYTSHPYELAEKGIELTAGRGVYFIDPLDKNPYKPTQMWTQGETNANSVWMPTVDAPNEQFTQEILITTDNGYNTLSNGVLVASTQNSDGTRTDHWEQKKAHSPYLAMMAIGQFHIAQEQWGAIDVTYYTQEEYSRDVTKIFGQTTYMMSFFSQLFQVEFPWEKYAQMVVTDYTAGAMENTSAVIYYDAYYADRYDQLDNNYDDVIAHELVHQWFGDLVACESWSHLSLNETFAQYGEYLWFDHKYGREHADQLHHESLFKYLNEFVYKSEPIVNYYYDDAEELFDAHRYDKGSCVMHMLRDYLGDQFFFDALADYLKTHQYGSAEIHDLRLSFEKISGEDLYWFFDQWFMKAGHPIVEIDHEYSEEDGAVIVSVNQTQDINHYTTFQFPISIDIYLNGSVERHQVWVDEHKETFKLPASAQPNLVNVDAKKILLWEKTESKIVEEWIFQYKNAPLYVDRIEAITELSHQQSSPLARAALLEALHDDFWQIRQSILNQINLEQFHASERSIELIQKMAMEDPHARVRRSALLSLAALDNKYASEAVETLLKQDSSRMVKGTALEILHEYDPESAFEAAVNMEFCRNYYMNNAVANIYSGWGDQSQSEFFQKALWSLRPYYLRNIMGYYVDFLQRMDTETVNDGANFLGELSQYEESEYLRNMAKDALYDLQDHFSRTKEDDDQEKAGILKSIIEGL